VTGAENQQERLIQRRGWVIGFVDGEGCFSIGFIRQSGGGSRVGYKTGYQVAHEFAVTQGERSKHALDGLSDYFGVGQVVANKRYDDHREHLYRYVVRRRDDLMNVIIPFFRRYPLETAKQRDFEKFAFVVELISIGWHLSREGLIEIAEVTETMNRQKPRHELIRILRGHTPDIRDIG
jgi:LAGLIDADG endonuclease